MLKRIIMGLSALFLITTTSPAFAQGISQKVAVCNPGFTNRCVAPDASGNTPVVGTVTVVPSGTQDVNVAQVGGNVVTTTLPVSDAGGSLTVDTLQLPSTLGIKTSANSLSVAPASDAVFQIGDAGGSITVDGTVAATQSGTWNINNVSGTVSLPTGASTAANQSTGNSSLASIDTKLTGVATAANQATANASLSSIDTKLTAPLSVVGNVASLATDSGNPVKVGCVYNSTLPSPTTGQRVDAQCDQNGNGRARWVLAPQSAGDGVANTASGTGTAFNDSSTALRALMRPEVFNSTSWDRVRSIQGSDGTGLGVSAVAWAPQSSANGAIVPVVSTALESCRVLKASAGNLYSLGITIQATSGVVQLFNATSAPADGAVTPIWSMPVLSNGTFGGASWNWNMPLRFSTGATVCFSSATTPFTKTASATAMFSGSIQ